MPPTLAPLDAGDRADFAAIEIISDPADLCALEDELDEKLSLDLGELATVDGMLQRGAHARAAANTILKARREGRVLPGEPSRRAAQPTADVWDTGIAEAEPAPQSIGDALAAQPPSDDSARMICDLLAERIEANGSKRPAITKAWLQAARKLLADRAEVDVRRAIDWCQADEWWHRRVLSMRTFCVNFDQIRLQAMSTGGGAVRKVEYTDEDYAAGWGTAPTGDRLPDEAYAVGW